MTWKIILGIAALVMILTVMITANTLRVSPPALEVAPPAADVAIDADAAAQRLAQAVRFRTISHGPEARVETEAFLGLHAYLAAGFPNVHATLEREIVNDYSLLYRWQGSDPSLKPILLNAHMDVAPVEPGTEARWTHPPFSGAIADGFIWGRGALDMKVSLTGILEAIEHLLAQAVTPARTVYLAFGHDEESGGPRGTKTIARLLEERGVRLLFTLDEGMAITHGIVPGVETPAALVGLAEKGRVTLELTAHAEGGHSSMPPVSTAVGKLGRALYRLETSQMPSRLKSPAADMFVYLAPEMSYARRIALANRWLFEPWLLSRLEETPAGNALIRTTTAPTIIQGGNKPNVLPSEARAVIDFRILPGDTVASVIEHVLATIDDEDVAVRQVGNEPSDPTPISDSRAESFTVLRKTIRQVFPDVVVAPGLVIGRTDSRNYVNVTENSYRFLPMRLWREDLMRIHGTDERIAVDNYLEIIRFYTQLLRNSVVAPGG